MVTKLGRKVLCLCMDGNSRSVALTFLLKNPAYGPREAVAAGVRTCSAETLQHLATWADDVVLVAEDQLPALRSKVPGVDAKLRVWNVGPDGYFRGFDDKLLGMYHKWLKEAT